MKLVDPCIRVSDSGVFVRRIIPSGWLVELHRFRHPILRTGMRRFSEWPRRVRELP